MTQIDDTRLQGPVCYLTLILQAVLLPVGQILLSLAASLFGTPNATLGSQNKKQQISSSGGSLFPAVLLFKSLASRECKQCSTQSNASVVSFTNKKGELEFRLVESQQPSPVTDSPVSCTPGSCGSAHECDASHAVNSSHDADALKHDDLVALSPADSSPVDGCIDSSPSEAGAGSGKSYKCPQCNSRFRIRGYLTRHMKKHSKQKAYRCPFFDENAMPKCHATGGFSRRDTYKTHLKARHFRYPPGVKSGERTGMMGWCGICGEKFVNNEVWVERHIETGICPGLPSDYIKSLKFGKKKTGKHSKLLDVVPDQTFYTAGGDRNGSNSSISGSNGASLTATTSNESNWSPPSSTMSPMQAQAAHFPGLTLSTTDSSVSSPSSGLAHLAKQEQQQTHMLPYFEDDYPSLDAESSSYTVISYPSYFYKNVNDDSGRLFA